MRSVSGWLKVDVGLASVTFDAQAAGSIAVAAGSSDVTVAVSIVDTSALPAAVRQTVGDRPVYDFTVTAGGSAVSSFGGGAVEVSIPYTLAAGEDPRNRGWYLGDDGTVRCPGRI